MRNKRTKKEVKTVKKVKTADKNKLNELAAGYAGAVLAAACMLLLGVLGNFGLYTSAAAMMGQWHMFFSLSIGGIIAGMIEAAVLTFLIVYAFAWLYNKFS